MSRENTEKRKPSVLMDKEILKVDKDGNEDINFLQNKNYDSARFIEISLSNLANNLTERTHKIKCKVSEFFFEYESLKVNLIKYKCLSCNKHDSHKLDEDLKKQFRNSFKFS